MAGGSSISVPIVASLMLIMKPVNVSAQSVDTRLATYILAGIAGLYTLFTCVCFLLAVCVCCNKNRRKSVKQYPYIAETRVVRPFILPAGDAIHPEVESPRELYGTVIENKCYAQENVKKDLDTAITNPSISENANIITNDYVHVHAIDQIKTEYRQKFRDSPLARHTPKIITHPVKVPYCDDTSSVNESEPGCAPVPQISISSQEGGHSLFELKSLKRGGQAGGRTASASHSPIKDTSKVALPQKGRLEMENDRSTCIPRTSPLPRSEHTKITDSTNKNVTLTKLCAELSGVAPKWYDVGVQLKISYKTLNAIRAINKRNTEICLMRVCEEWLFQEKRYNKVPTWITIIEVLKSKVISETEVAGLIHQKYCCNETEEEESDDEGEPASKSYTWVRLE